MCLDLTGQRKGLGSPKLAWKAHCRVGNPWTYLEVKRSRSPGQLLQSETMQHTEFSGNSCDVKVKAFSIKWLTCWEYNIFALLQLLITQWCRAQISTKNSVELVEDPGEVVNELATRLGLRPVGWIFTDLIPLDTSTGTVKHFRGNVNSHFLSAEECILAADLQSRHPNACYLSPDGHFGSKFVTVVVTGS